MSQRPKKTLAVKKETIRHLELRPLSNDQLAQVAGGTWQPRKSISCCC
jgi:hypothetical protein